MTATVKRLTIGIGAAALAIGVSAGAFVHAQDGGQQRPRFGEGRRGRPGGPGGFRGPGGPMGLLPMLGRDLELTDAQKDRIKSIADSHKDDWKALGDRMRAAHQALNQAVTADSIDENLIRQKSSEVAAVEADLAVARARARAEVFQVLTAEQRAKVKQRASRRPAP